MLWRITIPVILAGVLFITAETKKPRPQGSIPSPNKTKGNLSSERHHRLLQQKPEVLSSSREALVVTERRYLRRDWCKTQPLRQTISEEGCRSRTVVNRFCYGQCNSFYIPRHMGPSSGQAQSRAPASGSGRKSHNKAQEPFQSCSFCRPHRITQLTVQLDCPDLQPPFRHRKVQRVKQCRCMSVDVGGHGKLWGSRRPGGLACACAAERTAFLRLKWHQAGMIQQMCALLPRQTRCRVGNLTVLEKSDSSSCAKRHERWRSADSEQLFTRYSSDNATYLAHSGLLHLYVSFLIKGQQDCKMHICHKYTAACLMDVQFYIYVCVLSKYIKSISYCIQRACHSVPLN